MRILTIRESVWLNTAPGPVWRLILPLEEWPRWHRGPADARWVGSRGWKSGHRFRLSLPGPRRPFVGAGLVTHVDPERL